MILRYIPMNDGKYVLYQSFKRMGNYMHKYLILSLLITLLVFTESANQYVTIGTNTFGFAFEDTTLTTNMQARIIDDWKVMTEP